MAEQMCCVCHTNPGTKVIAGRAFCDEHYTKATYKRGGVWRSAGLAVVGLLVFVALVVGLEAWLKPQFSGPVLMGLGLVLALAPAVVWLVFFYQQDRLEPEPVGQVARLFVVGLALGGAVAIPLTSQFFKVEEWLYRDTLTTVLGSIFIIGGVGAFCVYASVRYFIFDSPEFDERTDGVVYGMAAGLGYATALNAQFILSLGQGGLGTGEIFVTEVALAQAAFGGLLGYFLGRAKLEREPVWWLPLGLGLTATLSGLFNYLSGLVDAGTVVRSGQAGLPSVTGLLLAGALAVVVTLIVSFLVERDIARSLSDKQTAVAGDPMVGDRQANWATIGVLAVLLIGGALVWNQAVNGTQRFVQGGISGAYPAYYGEEPQTGEGLHVVDNLGTGAEFIVTAVPLDAETKDVAAVQLGLTGERTTDYDAYTVMETSSATVAGQTATVQRFAYVEATGLTSAMPQLREGLDYLIPAGNRVVVVTLLATPETMPDVQPLFAKFLNSLQIGSN